MIRFTVGRNGNVKQQLKNEKKESIPEKVVEVRPAFQKNTAPIKAPNSKKPKPKNIEEYESTSKEESYPCKTPKPSSPAKPGKNSTTKVASPQLNTIASKSVLDGQINSNSELTRSTVLNQHTEKAIITVTGLINYNPTLAKLEPIPIQKLAEAFQTLTFDELSQDQQSTLEDAYSIIKGYFQMKPIVMHSNPTQSALSLLTELINHCNEREQIITQVVNSTRSIQEENLILKEVISNHASSSPEIHVFLTAPQSTCDQQFKSILVDKETATEEDNSTSNPSSANASVDSKIQSRIIPKVSIEGYEDPGVMTMEISVQTVPVVDDMPLRYRNKAEELNQQIISIKELHAKEITLLQDEKDKERREWENILKAVKSKNDSEAEELKSIVASVQRQNQSLKDKLKHFESSNEELEKKTASLKADIQVKEEAVQIAYNEKMETFKQFRTLNRLYDDIKENYEAVETKRNHLINHSKDLEHKCGILDARCQELSSKLRISTEELQAIKKEYDDIKYENNRITFEKNNLKKDRESLSQQLQIQEKKVQVSQETIESLMKFPDFSLGEEALTSPKFDQIVQDYIKGNNLRILVLEKKNDEYRALRIQHAELYSQELDSLEQLHERKSEDVPQMLYNPESISDTIRLLEIDTTLPPLNNKLGSHSLNSLYGTSTSLQNSARQRRSSLSAGKRGSGTSKNVSFNPENF